MSVISRTRFCSVPIIDKNYLKNISRIQALTILGMLIGHTGEGEAFSLPVIKSGKIFSDPYFDMDLVEFGMNQPMYNRLSLSRNSRSIFYFEKKIARALALRYLPHELVYRKKGMTVPTKRDNITKDFFDSLPREMGCLSLNDPEERLAARVLSDFVSRHSIKW